MNALPYCERLFIFSIYFTMKSLPLIILSAQAMFSLFALADEGTCLLVGTYVCQDHCYLTPLTFLYRVSVIQVHTQVVYLVTLPILARLQIIIASFQWGLGCDLLVKTGKARVQDYLLP